MNRFLKLCLVYLIATLGVFGTYLSSAQASIFNLKTGVADRVRKYNMFEYYYYGNNDKYYNSGFQCAPDPVRLDTEGVFDEVKQKLSDDGTGDIEATIASTASAVGVTALKTSEAILAPLACGYVMSSISKGKSELAVSGIILTLGNLASAFYEEYVVASDYGLDPNNSTCYMIILPMMVQCLVFSIVTNIKKGSKVAKFAVLAIVIALYQAIEKTIVAIQVSLAKDVFPNLRICGDAWYTYGYNNANSSIETDDNKKVKSDNILDNYPIKGIFEGAYEYYLIDCVVNDNIQSCLKIGSTRINADTNSAIGGLRYKAYREYKYGGMEYKYDGCEDPRPEAKLYDINSNLEDSDKIPQLYYAKGSDGINFACERFAEKTEWQDAFKCCINASNKLLCVEYFDRSNSKAGNFYKFCEISGDGNDYCNIEVDRNFAAEQADAQSEFQKKEAQDNDACKNYKNKSKFEDCKNGKNTYDETCKSCVKYDNICEKLNDNSCKNYKYACFAVVDISKENISDSDKSLVKDCIDTFSNNNKDYELPTLVNSIKLKIVESSQDVGKYCFSTQNFCPYDFNILGGTEKIGVEFQDSSDCGINSTTEVFECKMSRNSKCVTVEQNGNEEVIVAKSCHGRPSNFCQIDRHCMKLNPYPYIEKEQPTFPYIDKSCINGIGSSHNRDNFESYNSYQRVINLKNHLTAPIVECVVETTKNLLLGKAGFTKCLEEGEVPYNGETCDSGYRFKKGEDIGKYGKYESVFEKIRKTLSYITKVLLSLAIVFYGFNFVVFGKSFNKEEFLKFAAKIFIVIMLSLTPKFALNFFDGIFSFSSNVVDLIYAVLQIDDWKPNYDNVKFDGCYFSYHEGFLNNYSEYPSGRKYIAFFDYIDCKFMKYMGFDVGSMDIMFIIVLFLFSGILTLILLLPLLIIFLTLIFVVVKISYIFMVATMTMTILLFFAPIIVPLCLFNRTKSIFDGWVKQIINYIFYPIFLVVAVTMLFYVYDTFFISDAQFLDKNGPYRSIYCGWYCKTQDSGHKINDIESEPNEDQKATCVLIGGEVIELSNYPICIYKSKQKVVTNTNNSFLSFFFDLRTNVLEISTSTYKFLFMNYAILLVILLFIENVIDSVVDLGQSIFGANVDRSSLNGMSVVNVMGKIINVVTDIASKQINAQVAIAKRGVVKMREDINRGKKLKEEDNE